MMQGGACKHAFFCVLFAYFLVPKLCLGTHLHNKLRLYAKQSFADKFIPKVDFGNENNEPFDGTPEILTLRSE